MRYKLLLFSFITITFSTFAQANLPFNLSEVTWLHYPGVQNWPVTSKLNVQVTANEISLKFDKTQQWKSDTIRHTSGTHDIQVNANPWVFVELNNNWYAGTFEWMRPGGTTKARKAVNGDHIKQPPLKSWSPKSGETYYFMVAGLTRGGPKGSHERTDIVAVQWPDSNESAAGSVGGSESAGPETGGQVASTGGGQEGLPFDLNEVEWLHPTVANWPETTELKVEVGGPFIDLRFDKTNQWKSIALEPGADDPVAVNANPWVFVNTNGKWHAGTFEWIRPGNTRKSKVAVNGDHIKQPPLSDWSPIPGEVYYFMVSGLARHGYKGSHERSNIVAVRWPGDGESSRSISPSEVNNGGASGNGAGGPTNGEAIVGDTMTLVITCKSGKTLGLFKKRRICGGELFSELISHELVEQIGEKYICTEGNTFGVHDGHAIWVKGCKGRFKVTGIRKGQQAESKELPIPDR